LATPPKKAWQISAQDRTGLFSEFGEYGISVPDRTQPKDPFAEELYCLRRFLFPLAESGRLEFPITVTKGESPDFRLSRAGMTTGLEVRKATAAEFEADLTRLARGRETKHYESDLDEGAMNLSFAGWACDGAEREVVEYILASIAAKLELLDSYSVDACDLLIYDNTPTAAPDLGKIAAVLPARFKDPLRSAKGQSFGVISVIRDPWLIYDIGGTPAILKYNPEWDIP
jgi:hypothetical protein